MVPALLLPMLYPKLTGFGPWEFQGLWLAPWNNSKVQDRETLAKYSSIGRAPVRFWRQSQLLIPRESISFVLPKSTKISMSKTFGTGRSTVPFCFSCYARVKLGIKWYIYFCFHNSLNLNNHSNQIIQMGTPQTVRDFPLFFLQLKCTHTINN